MGLWSRVQSYYQQAKQKIRSYVAPSPKPVPKPAPKTTAPKTTYTPPKPSTPTYGGTTGYGYVAPPPKPSSKVSGVSGPIAPSYRPPPSKPSAPTPSVSSTPTGSVGDIQMVGPAPPRPTPTEAPPGGKIDPSTGLVYYPGGLNIKEPEPKVGPAPTLTEAPPKTSPKQELAATIHTGPGEAVTKGEMEAKTISERELAKTKLRIMESGFGKAEQLVLRGVERVYPTPEFYTPRPSGVRETPLERAAGIPPYREPLPPFLAPYDRPAISMSGIKPSPESPYPQYDPRYLSSARLYTTTVAMTPIAMTKLFALEIPRVGASAIEETMATRRPPIKTAKAIGAGVVAGYEGFKELTPEERSGLVSGVATVMAISYFAPKLWSEHRVTPKLRSKLISGKRFLVGRKVKEPAMIAYPERLKAGKPLKIRSDFTPEEVAMARGRFDPWKVSRRIVGTARKSRQMTLTGKPARQGLVQKWAEMRQPRAAAEYLQTTVYPKKYGVPFPKGAQITFKPAPSLRFERTLWATKLGKQRLLPSAIVYTERYEPGALLRGIMKLAKAEKAEAYLVPPSPKLMVAEISRGMATVGGVARAPSGMALLGLGVGVLGGVAAIKTRQALVPRPMMAEITMPVLAPQVGQRQRERVIVTPFQIPKMVPITTPFLIPELAVGVTTTPTQAQKLVPLLTTPTITTTTAPPTTPTITKSPPIPIPTLKDVSQKGRRGKSYSDPMKLIGLKKGRGRRTRKRRGVDWLKI